MLISCYLQRWNPTPCPYGFCGASGSPKKGCNSASSFEAIPDFEGDFGFMRWNSLVHGCLRFVFEQGSKNMEIPWNSYILPYQTVPEVSAQFFLDETCGMTQIESVDVSVSNWRLNLSNWGKGETLNARKPTCQLHQKAGKHSETWKCRFPSIVARPLMMNHQRIHITKISP